MYKKIFVGSIFLVSFFVLIATMDTGVVFKKAFAAASLQQKKQEFDYKKSMIDLIGQISAYAKNKNNSFQVIQNDGLPLFGYTRDKAGEQLLTQVDGVLLEGLYYVWKYSDFQRANAKITYEKEEALKLPQKNGITILNIDYCNRVDAINNSIRLNKSKNIIGFAAQDRMLNRIPKYPWQITNENNADITKLNEVKNFLTLLSADRIFSKKKYLSQFQETNYDLLIIDLIYNGQPLLPEDIALLKKKKNGASRLVFAYMSVGEAESYRGYWQESWYETLPEWIDEVNPEWEGNYKVKYWSKEWKNMLFGEKDSYLDMILNAGFDGVFMDVIDAYDYFEEKAQISQ